MKGVFILLVFLACASCNEFEDDYRQMTAQVIQRQDALLEGRRLKQQSHKLPSAAMKSRSEFSKKLTQLMKEKQVSKHSKPSSHTKRQLSYNRKKVQHKRDSSKRKLRSKIQKSKKLIRRKSKKNAKKGKRAKKSVHKKGKQSRKMADLEVHSVGDILRIPPETLGIHAETDNQKLLSAAGTTALGYGIYNYLTRKEDFEAYGKKLVEGYKNRERILGLISNQVSQLQEISMGLNICKNRVKRIGSLFSESVLNRIKPGSTLF